MKFINFPSSQDFNSNYPFSVIPKFTNCLILNLKFLDRNTLSSYCLNSKGESKELIA